MMEGGAEERREDIREGREGKIGKEVRDRMREVMREGKEGRN